MIKFKTGKDIYTVEWLLQKTMNAMSLLRERNVPVFIACPAMQENKAALPHPMRWADENGIPSYVDLFIFGSSDYSGSNLSHRLSFADLEDFFTMSLENNGTLACIWGSKNTVSPDNLFYGTALYFGRRYYLPDDRLVYTAWSHSYG